MPSVRVPFNHGICVTVRGCYLENQPQSDCRLPSVPAQSQHHPRLFLLPAHAENIDILEVTTPTIFTTPSPSCRPGYSGCAAQMPKSLEQLARLNLAIFQFLERFLETLWVVLNFLFFIADTLDLLENCSMLWLSKR